VSDGVGAIVDAHHHLWDPGRRRYAWMDDEALAPIRRRYAVDDLRDAASANGVTSTVLVQAVGDVDESVELCAMAVDSDGLIAGVVGWVDLTAGRGVLDQLSRIRGSTGGDRLVGVRHQVQDEVDRDWLSRPNVTAGIRAVGTVGLVYDLLVHPDQLASAARLAGRLDSVTFVLDHAAKPPFTAGAAAMAEWAAGLAALAERPNVVCKLSGLVTEAAWSTWTVDTLRPAADHVIDVFGPDRVMFGSDWPVCELAGSYHQVVDAARQLTASLRPAERAAIFAGTARRVYRLP
jgi:L-fuconolactonase